MCRATDYSQDPGLTSALSSLKLASEDKEQKLALLEEAWTAMGKEARELRTGLQELERSWLEARQQLQELQHQVLSLCHPLSWGLLCVLGPVAPPFWNHVSPYVKPGPSTLTRPLT